MLLEMKTRNQQLERFDPSIVTVKQSSIVGQIVSSPVVLSELVLLDLVNKSFVRRWYKMGKKYWTAI